MKRFNQPCLRYSWFCMFVFLYVPFFQRQSFWLLFYSTVAGVVPSGILWDHWAYPDYFENRIPLNPTLGKRGRGGGWGAYAVLQSKVLHMKRLQNTESPFFEILCFLCFQMPSFWTFILVVWKKTTSLVCVTSALKQFMINTFNIVLIRTWWIISCVIRE